MHSIIKKALLAATICTSGLQAATISGEMTLNDFLKLPQSVRDQYLGDHKDNGGDGVVQENGEIIIRDFLSNNGSYTLNASQVIEKYPEVGDLFRKLLVNAEDVTKSLIGEFEDMEFVFVNGVLPLLPSSHTGLVLSKANVQIAIRRDDKVIVSTPAFERTQGREYLILHEILHGLVNIEEDWPALKHAKVREVTSYIKNNIDDINEEEFNEYMWENTRQFKKSSGYWGFGDRDRFQVQEADTAVEITKFIFDENNSYQDRCDLYKLIHDDNKVASYAYFLGESSFASKLFVDSEKCLAQKDSRRFKRLRELFPHINDYITSKYYSPSVYDVERDVKLREIKDREKIIEQCKYYANKKLAASLTEARNLFKPINAEESKLVNTFTNSTDTVDNYFGELISYTFSGRLKYINERAIPTYNKNVKYCKKKVGLRRFYDVKN